MVTKLKDTGRPPRARVHSVPAVETMTFPSSMSALSSWSCPHSTTSVPASMMRRCARRQRASPIRFDTAPRRTL